MSLDVLFMMLHEVYNGSMTFSSATKEYCTLSACERRPSVRHAAMMFH